MSEKRVFVIDVGRCCGCYNCQLACKDEHVGNDWGPYARPQPDVGQFWLKVEPHECGTVPKVKMHYIPRMCRHCENAPCTAVAPDAVYKRDDGLVIIDPEEAVGRPEIIESCPYGAIYWNDDLKLAQKCTGCAHLLDNGYESPRCVEACPTDALMFGTEAELQGLIARAEEPGFRDHHGSRVYYLSVPKRFIAGTVYDPMEKEVVIGAVCKLTSRDQQWSVETDEYGDFWFRDLEADGTYDLIIESEGFLDQSFLALTAAQDVNLGDIPLVRLVP